MRIVSLLPSATEIVCALGLEEALVGRSHECDWPPSVRRLPVCTSASIDSTQASGAIDAQVRTLLTKALSLYQVDTAMLAELAPDIIVTQAQCEVCAVSLAEVERAVAETLGSSARVVSLTAVDFAGVLADVARVADACDRHERGEKYVGRLRARMADIRRRSAERAVPARRPTVAALEWTDPLMTAGNWVPELVAAAGGTPVLASAGEHSPWITWEQLVAADPDVIVSMPCGFDIRRTRAETRALASLPEWNALRAVARGNVFLTDANHFFSRPGPRLVESAAILAEIFDTVCGVRTVEPVHAGHDWERL